MRLKSLSSSIVRSSSRPRPCKSKRGFHLAESPPRQLLWMRQNGGSSRECVSRFGESSCSRAARLQIARNASSGRSGLLSHNSHKSQFIGQLLRVGRTGARGHQQRTVVLTRRPEGSPLISERVSLFLMT
jgi:hypothetical protein